MKELQKVVHKIREDRGFTMDPIRIFTLLNEEVGEVAKELKKTWSVNYDGLEKEKLADELADVQVLLFALATQFDIDLKMAVEKKFVEADSKRVWKSAVKK